MNLEAINKWLNEEYGCSYTRLEELHDFYFEKYCDLKQENKQLKEKVDKYENPEDMTLFAMWCTEKVKEENQKLQTIANNCKQLKEYLFDIRKRGFALQNLANVTKTTEPNIAILIIINKMQELERGNKFEK